MICCWRVTDEHVVSPTRRSERELQKPNTLETKRRLQKLIAEHTKVSTSPTSLRKYRAVQALEYIGTTNAKTELKHLAAGPANSIVTREAQASVRRLARIGR